MLNLWPHEAPCLVIGHRGAMGYSPENTLVSFEDAVRRGADLIEMDVQLSSDGEVVIMHDTSVGRTTDGEGFVRDLPWKKIKTLDAGIWFGPHYSGQFVPSLEMAITKFRSRKTSTGSPLGFIIELKTVKGSGGSLADTVVALLQREKFTERAVVISFDMVALQEVRQADKNISTGLLYSEGTEEFRLQQAATIGAQTLCPRKTCVTSKGVLTAHKANLSVSPWTANTKIEMKRLIACGVDALTTNYPDRLRAVMG